MANSNHRKISRCDRWWRAFGPAAAWLVATALALPAVAQDSGIPLDYKMDSEDKLAQQLNNPLANLISVPIQNNFDYGLGRDGEGRRFTMVAQPVLPFELNPDWNLITRTLVPYARVSNVFPDTESGLGDIVFSAWFSPARPTAGGWILGLGPAVLLPTASNDLLGADQWGGGPSAVAVRVVGPWTSLILTNYIWAMSSPSDGRDKVSQGFIQLAQAYTAPTRTTYFVSTESSYDHNQSQWTVPLQLGINQLLRFGDGLPFQIGGLARYYVDKPDGGPNWGFQIRLTLVFPK